MVTRFIETFQWSCSWAVPGSSVSDVFDAKELITHEETLFHFSTAEFLRKHSPRSSPRISCPHRPRTEFYAHVFAPVFLFYKQVSGALIISFSSPKEAALSSPVSSLCLIWLWNVQRLTDTDRERSALESPGGVAGGGGAWRCPIRDLDRRRTQEGAS